MQSLLKKIPKILDEVQSLSTAATQGNETETEGGGWSGTEQVGHEIGLDPNKKLKMENSSQYGYYLRIARAVPSLALSSRARTGACGP